MIFVTIGTQKYDFNRIFDYINDYVTDEEILVQKGKSRYKFRKGIKVVDFLSYEEMEKVFKKARVIVTHGGVGTIYKALCLGKKVIVIPRLKKYKEHINDHQFDICKYLEEKGLCVMVTSRDEFIKAMEEIEKKKFKKYINHQEEFAKKMKEQIDELLGDEV